MPFKTSFSLALLILFFSVRVFAQQKLSEAETQNFYSLIKQTAEYKTMQRKVDSVNKIQNEVPQEIKIWILTKETGAPDGKYLPGDGFEKGSWSCDRTIWIQIR